MRGEVRTGMAGKRGWADVATALKWHAHGGFLKARGQGVRAERTRNICAMSVTLVDVSKLSGWLNTFALCRVARWA